MQVEFIPCNDLHQRLLNLQLLFQHASTFDPLVMPLKFISPRINQRTVSSGLLPQLQRRVSLNRPNKDALTTCYFSCISLRNQPCVKSPFQSSRTQLSNICLRQSFSKQTNFMPIHRKCFTSASGLLVIFYSHELQNTIWTPSR